MTKSLKIIYVLLFSAVFVIINVYLFKNALEFSTVYPFKRVLQGDTLISNIDTAESTLKFKSKIIKIEGEEVNKNRAYDLLKKYKNKQNLNIVFVENGLEVHTNVLKNGINRDYFLFLIFLLIFGSIHYLWGGIIYFFRPYKIRSKIFLLSSFALGFFYYNLIDQFTFGNYNLTFVAIVLLLGFLSVVLGFNFRNQATNRLVSALILVFAFVMVFFSYTIIRTHGTLGSYVYMPLFIYLILCTLFSIVKLTYGIIKNSYSFIIWRYVGLILGLFICNSIPVLNILFSMYSDAALPICLSSGLTLLSPLIAGNALLNYNQQDFYGLNFFKLNDIKLLLLNIIIAILSSVLLYSFLGIPDFSYHKIFSLLTTVFVIIILINSQHFLMKSLKKSGFENKDNYAFSAQKIAELSSSPENLKYKLEHIFSEISGITGVVSLKLLLFLDNGKDYYSNFHNFIEVLPKNSYLYSFIKINKGAILKYALIGNSALEERVYGFLEEKKSIFAIPVIDGENIRGALLVGERARGGFYSNADLHYFQTVIYQMMQLIQSDYLHKDYIIKKQYEKELDNASYVQLRLFPKAALERSRGIDISFFYRPYQRVIGDYFDFFKVDKERTAIIIGDVSGHGLSTAMVLSAVNSITHAILAEEKSFEKTFEEINNYLNKSYRGIELITLFIGIFDKKTKMMNYINAGHGAPILIKKKEKIIRQIEGRSKILGADPDAEYTASGIALETDDELILYTDGVMEIHNEITGSGINEEKFMNIISENIERNIDGKIIEIEKIVKLHSEDIRDDITIIGVKVH